MSEDEDDWIDSLIKLGIGALAVYFLVKLVSNKDQENSAIRWCPHCGAEIRKWAVVCPSCRKRIRTTPIGNYDY